MSKPCEDNCLDMTPIAQNETHGAPIQFEVPHVGMAWFPFLVEIILVLVLVIRIIRKYISFKRTPLWVFLAATLGMGLGFALVSLMPIDIAMANYNRCVVGSLNPADHRCVLPLNYVDPDILKIFWGAAYWIMFFSTWLIYPIGQSFVTTGEFGVWRKLRASVIDNLIFYGIAGVVGVGFFIGLFFYEGRDLSTAISVALALATVWGTFLLVVFMGVGLVEIPRTCWRNANFHVMLRYYQFKLTAQHEELNQAHTEITTVEKLIKNLDDNVPISDPNRSCVDTLIAECPPDYALLEKGEGKVKTGYGDIVELHSRLISAKHNWNQATTLYETTLKRAFKLDDIVAAKDELRSTRMIKWTYKPARRFRFKLLTDVVNFMEWLWLTKIAEWFWRVASVLLAIASLLLIFCEVTMFVVFLEAPTGRGLPATISPLTLLVRSADLSPLGIQLISLAVVAYMATCTFSSLFSFRFLSWYKLLPDQQTDSYSILFCAAYLSRLAPPLVLNLLYLINYDLPEYNSAYIQIMGPMTRVPFFGQKFNVIFPCLIVFMSVATLFSCWSRIMSCLPCCRSRSFSYDEWDDDEQVESGRDLISKERAQRRRGVAAEMRNQDPNIAVDLENQNEIDEVDRRRGAGRSTRPPAATTSGPSSSSSSSSTSAAGTGSSSSRFREKYVPGSYSKGKSSAASTAAPVSGGSGGGFLSLFSRGNQTSELQSGGTPAGSGPRPTFVADDPFSRPAKRSGAKSTSVFGSDSDDDGFL